MKGAPNTPNVCQIKEDASYFNTSPKHSARYKELHFTKFKTLETDGLVLRMDAREADVYGERVLELLRRDGPDRVCVVPQPAVFADPAAIEERIHRFLGLDPMAESLFDRIDRSAVGHWRAPLTVAELAVLDEFRDRHQEKINMLEDIAGAL